MLYLLSPWELKIKPFFRNFDTKNHWNRKSSTLTLSLVYVAITEWQCQTYDNVRMCTATLLIASHHQCSWLMYRGGSYMLRMLYSTIFCSTRRKHMRERGSFPQEGTTEENEQKLLLCHVPVGIETARWWHVPSYSFRNGESTKIQKLDRWKKSTSVSMASTLYNCRDQG